MQSRDTNLQTPLPKSHAAVVLREMAESYFRHAQTASDPERWIMAASEFHAKALKLEAGIFSVSQTQSS